MCESEREPVKLGREKLDLDKISRMIERISSYAEAQYREDRDCNPAQLCHYTSAEGLYGIVSDGAMRLTHGSYLNDPNEIKYGRRLALDVLRTLGNAATGHTRSLSSEFAGTLEMQHDIESTIDSYYCACFTEVIDGLPQFREYADNLSGYCLVFDTVELLDFMSPNGQIGDSCPFDFVKILYNRETQASLLSDLFVHCQDQILQEFPELLTSDKKYYELLEIAEAWCVGSERLALRFKQPGYSHEREWRVAVSAAAILRFRRLLDNLEPNVFVNPRSRLLTPYIATKPNNHHQLSYCLKKIIIGPGLRFEDAERGVRILLRKYLPKGQDEHIDVVPSEWVAR